MYNINQSQLQWFAMNKEEMVLIYAMPAHDKNLSLTEEDLINLKTNLNGMTAWQIQRKGTEYCPNLISGEQEEISKDGLDAIKNAYRKDDSVCVYALLIPRTLLYTRESNPEEWPSALYNDSEKEQLKLNDRISNYNVNILNSIGVFELPESEITIIGCYYNNHSSTQKIYLFDEDAEFEEYSYSNKKTVSKYADWFGFQIALDFDYFHPKTGDNLQTISLDLNIINPTKQFKKQLMFFQSEARNVNVAFAFETPAPELKIDNVKGMLNDIGLFSGNTIVETDKQTPINSIFKLDSGL